MLISKYRIWYQKRDFFFSVRCWVMCSIQKKRVGIRILVSAFLIACWHHWERETYLLAFSLPSYEYCISLCLVGLHWWEDGRNHSQESPSLAAAWHSRAKWERCCWITPRWSAMLDRRAVCVKDRHSHHPATLSKGSKSSSVWKISELPYVWIQSS